MFSADSVWSSGRQGRRRERLQTISFDSPLPLARGFTVKVFKRKKSNATEFLSRAWLQKPFSSILRPKSLLQNFTLMLTKALNVEPRIFVDISFGVKSHRGGASSIPLISSTSASRFRKSLELDEMFPRVGVQICNLLWIQISPKHFP